AAWHERSFHQICIRAITDQSKCFSCPSARAGAEIAARSVGIGWNSPNYAAREDQERESSGNRCAKSEQREPENIARTGTFFFAAPKRAAEDRGQAGGNADAENKEEHMKRSAAKILPDQVADPQESDGGGHCPVGEGGGDGRLEPRDRRFGFTQPAEM